MPARRYIVSPQGGGHLRLLGETLPAAFYGQAYAQDISFQASAGVPPRIPFTLLAQTGPDGWGITAVGVINGTPAIPNIRIDDTGAYRIDNLGNVRIST